MKSIKSTFIFHLETKISTYKILSFSQHQSTMIELQNIIKINLINIEDNKFKWKEFTNLFHLMIINKIHGNHIEKLNKYTTKKMIKINKINKNKDKIEDLIKCWDGD
jgi:hypothetical protein